MSVESLLPVQAIFYYALLRYLSRYPEGCLRHDIIEGLPDLMGLNNAQRSEHLSNLNQLRYRHRGGWGLSALKAAGYVDSPAPRIWRLTARGRELLERYPDGFDEATGRRVIREGRREILGQLDLDGDSEELSAQQSPEERMEAILDEINHAVAQELLERILQSPPEFFESLVLDLLHALGYGANEEALEQVGRSGDGGIDGIISLDRLGFEKVCVQAKRWQGTVGRPEVQAFYGALAGRRVRKGVFITTSSFTPQAREFAVQVSDAIVLIDGPRLTSLMIEHGVAVSHYRIIRLPRVDGDYFELT